MATPREVRKFQSYKEERLRSARKGLNESVSFSKDIEELESAVKISINRRSHGTFNLMRRSLQKQLSQSQTMAPLTESALRLSNVNDKFISKYMDKNSNIVEVSQQQPQLQVLVQKSISSNILVKPKKKLTESVRVERFQKLALSSTRNLGKLTESRVVQKALKKRATKAEISRVLKKVETLQEDVQKLQLACGREVANQFQKIINRMREEC